MMKNTFLYLLLALAMTGNVFITGQAVASESGVDNNLVARGRYLARVSGCNDCHTPGYFMNDGTTPVAQWLSGSDFGWRGPWGTTYGPNLRLFVKDMTEDQWVEAAHTLKRRPPMPWYNLNAMDDGDLRALYRFMHSLGDPGPPAPAYLPPGEEPQTPYALFPSPPAKE